MTTTPVRVTRWSPMRRRRSFTCSGREEARMSKRSCTAFDTLLTFCPPAPCARIAVISISFSATRMLTLLDVEQLHFEDEGGIRRNHAAGAARSVAQLRRNGELALAADFHAGDAF